PAPEVEGAEPCADHRRLPAADDVRIESGKPGPRGVPDLAEPEGPGARPRGSGARTVSAFARRGAAPRQETDPFGPARIGQSRAGLGPRLLHLPRRVLQRRDRGTGDRRSAPRPASKRPDWDREARLVEPVRAVRGPRAERVADQYGRLTRRASDCDRRGPVGG